MPSQLKAIQREEWLRRALNRRRTAKRLLRYSHVSSNGSPLLMLRHLYCVSSTTCKLCSPSFLFSCRLREKLSERARESSEFSRARKGLGLASSAFKLSLFKKNAPCQSPQLSTLTRQQQRLHFFPMFPSFLFSFENCHRCNTILNHSTSFRSLPLPLAWQA